VIALLALTTVAGAILTWNLDDVEYIRLFVPVGVSLRIGILLAITVSADALVRRSREV
jgi:hypothetical protein